MGLGAISNATQPLNPASVVGVIKTAKAAAKIRDKEAWDFAERAGVALTVIRKIEQGKGNLNMETVNHVLLMFGHTLAPVPAKSVEPIQF